MRNKVRPFYVIREKSGLTFSRAGWRHMVPERTRQLRSRPSRTRQSEGCPKHRQSQPRNRTVTFFRAFGFSTRCLRGFPLEICFDGLDERRNTTLPIRRSRRAPSGSTRTPSLPAPCRERSSAGTGHHSDNCLRRWQHLPFACSSSRRGSGGSSPAA